MDWEPILQFMRDFDSFTAEEMAASGSMKWTMFPGTLGMWLAEMDYGIADELSDYLCGQVRNGLLGYLPRAESKEVLAATASFLEKLNGLQPDPQRMALLPDVLTGFRLAIELFARPGCSVVVPTPAYMPFLTIPPEMGHDVVEVPSILGEDGLWRLDFDGLAKAFANGGGIVVLCNPWNPTGRSLTRPELERLAELAERYDVRVFEDAIHLPLLLEDAEAVPFAAVSESTKERTVTAISASKGWNIPGLKCAQVIFHNEADAETFGKAGARYCGGTSTIGARAAKVCYEQAQGWNAQVRSYVAELRDLVEARVAGWEGVRMGHVEATYIGFIDFSGLAATGIFGDSSPAAWLREHAGVAFTDGKLCGTGFENWVRVSFANSRPVVLEALDRVEKALGLAAN